MKNILIRQQDIASLFKDKLSDYVKDKISEYKLTYSPFEKEEEKQVIIKISSDKISGAPVDVSLDMTKVKNEFGKTEYVSFDEGLVRTIEWQKELYKINFKKNEK